MCLVSVCFMSVLCNMFHSYELVVCTIQLCWVRLWCCQIVWVIVVVLVSGECVCGDSGYIEMSCGCVYCCGVVVGGGVRVLLVMLLPELCLCVVVRMGVVC